MNLRMFQDEDEISTAQLCDENVRTSTNLDGIFVPLVTSFRLFYCNTNSNPRFSPVWHLCAEAGGQEIDQRHASVFRIRRDAHVLTAQPSGSNFVRSFFYFYRQLPKPCF